jgi:hypothetical protein
VDTLTREKEPKALRLKEKDTCCQKISVSVVDEGTITAI